MSKPKNSEVYHIPRWQSEKMRMILSDRWKEVWEVVETRAKDRRNLLRYQRNW